MVFSEGLYILGSRYSARTEHRDLLMNFLFGHAKLATWLTRRNGLRGLGTRSYFSRGWSLDNFGLSLSIILLSKTLMCFRMCGV